MRFLAGVLVGLLVMAGLALVGARFNAARSVAVYEPVVAAPPAAVAIDGDYTTPSDAAAYGALTQHVNGTPVHVYRANYTRTWVSIFNTILPIFLGLLVLAALRGRRKEENRPESPLGLLTVLVMFSVSCGALVGMLLFQDSPHRADDAILAGLIVSGLAFGLLVVTSLLFSLSQRGRGHSVSATVTRLTLMSIFLGGAVGVLLYGSTAPLGLDDAIIVGALTTAGAYGLLSVSTLILARATRPLEPPRAREDAAPRSREDAGGEDLSQLSQELYRQAQRMEERIETLETLLLEQPSSGRRVRQSKEVV